MKKRKSEEGEFLWLISLSDLMMLLFIFFMALFSQTTSRLSPHQLERIRNSMNGKQGSETTLDKIAAEIKLKLAQHIANKRMTVRYEGSDLQLEMNESLLFKSGAYDLTPEGKSALKDLGSVVKDIGPPFQIAIEGHTDDVPIDHANIRDNWELGAFRAHAVLLELTLTKEVLTRTQLVSLADRDLQIKLKTKRAPADSSENLEASRRANRKVTIRIY